MKYPFVIFYRKDENNDLDNFFISKANLLNCSIFIANSLENVKNLFNVNYQLLVTYGGVESDIIADLKTVISQSMIDSRHCHLKVEDSSKISVNEFNNFINCFYIKMCSESREKTRPTFSLFTPTYNSYDKIFRVYNSLKKQTLLDWEWVIMDDSPDDKHFNFLREHFINDSRIRFYRRSTNNGSIGNVKNETIGLCRGKYVVEMDHDDELMPYVLKESAELFDKDSELGFIYYDCACVYEDGRNQWYGDFLCKGYGGYYSQKIDNKWRLIYITPNINNITMSHLVCCPNHPRIWRRETLMKLGSYCEYLPICDDYEILIKTSVSSKIAKVHKLGYIQYMNNGNNNFSLIRNAEINRIGPNYISPIYYDEFSVNEVMKTKNAYEDEKYISQHSKIWQRDPNTYTHLYCNDIINTDFTKQYCIIGMDSLIKNLDKITELYKCDRNDFILLDNQGSTQYLQERLDNYNFSRMKCYHLLDATKTQLIKYFELLYLSTSDYEIIDSCIIKPEFNTNINNRCSIINKLTKPSQKYLEIGVEYCQTFNNTHFVDKLGVDPDPKSNATSGTIISKTSNDFFLSLSSSETFDVIFIDGMHQTEYVLTDINNSINVLNNDGIIFVDDILPFNYNEQLKIPIKHYYENGILKYGENWTGDVWKVIYYILIHFSCNLKRFQYFYNNEFRGIAMFQFKTKFQIDENDIKNINDFSYFDDYSNYVSLLQQIHKSFN